MTTSNNRRTIKALIVGIIGCFFTLIFLTNLVDYQSNFAFVQHVLSMDTIFPWSTLVSRAITSPMWWTIAYWAIIITEGITALLCIVWAIKMLSNVRDLTRYTISKKWAYRGLFLCFALFTFGFVVVWWEWFAMRQSDTRNGLEAATRVMIMTWIGILILASHDVDM